VPVAQDTARHGHFVGGDVVGAGDDCHAFQKRYGDDIEVVRGTKNAREVYKNVHTTEEGRYHDTRTVSGQSPPGSLLRASHERPRRRQILGEDPNPSETPLVRLQARRSGGKRPKIPTHQQNCIGTFRIYTTFISL
jgi:hypothetical protein